MRILFVRTTSLNGGEAMSVFNPDHSAMEMGALQVAGVVAGAVCAILASTDIWQGTMLGVVYGSLAYYVWMAGLILATIFHDEDVCESFNLTWKGGGIAFLLSIVVVPLGVLAVVLFLTVRFVGRLFTYDDAPQYLDYVAG